MQKDATQGKQGDGHFASLVWEASDFETGKENTQEEPFKKNEIAPRWS